MLLIKNGLLHTMETEQPIRADLLVENGKIKKITSDIAPTGQMEVLDATKTRLLPHHIYGPLWDLPCPPEVKKKYANRTLRPPAS